ncbi:uncharacterized protein [Epargyreus clarus]|uniref:uncharacterized protein n=1 Tax=Epargyreus clarus TaxID=520877 RepID=UPI003C2EAAA7
MVCDGPDPPENTPHNLSPPPRHLLTNGNHHEDSDEEQNEHFGYEPLPQGPEAVFSDRDSSDDETDENEAPTNGVPDIEPMEATLTREVWNVPRDTDPIQMDNDRAQQVMSAMANFALPQTSIPEWAQSVSEEQWKQTLNDKIEKIRSNR